MTEKEPFGFVLEPDGSVGIDAYPSSTDGEGPWHHVGHVRLSPDGTVISSLTFEEPQNYDDWEAHADVDEAVLALLKDCIESIDSKEVEEYDRDRLLSLRRSNLLVRKYSHRVKEALARSAQHALAAAVKNMLRVSTHDEVMKTVSEALVGSVMEE
jgi:hypothetical protein